MAYMECLGIVCSKTQHDAASVLRWNGVLAALSVGAGIKGELGGVW